ncbi:glycoside hydrolase family 31 protein [Novosphingobium sp.]|uniref:glycoside hydrolase family 31 protein n=1 Tax=Novosphingobium sp. TaxID=1874826 RepID=UPI0025DF119A|nr:glycoside hydrolase family 31 protein [Novosphingobium sp.]
MRRATLTQPPIFAVSERGPGRVTLASDTGALAHIFVLEQDIVRLLLLPDGTLHGGPSWSIAPGAEDIAEPGRDRMSVEGFACPEFALSENEGALRIETTQLRLDVMLRGLHCSWSLKQGDGWQVMAADRPTQAYDFGWWDGAVHHYLTRQPGERFYALGERSGPMDRSGRRFRLTNLDAMGYDAETGDPLYKHIPYVLAADESGACHGEFYDNTSDMVFDFGAELDNYHGHYRHVRATAGDLDLWMIAGPDPLAVTRRFTWLTGRPALMPRWSLGYSGSTMSYTDAPDAQVQMAQFLAHLEEQDIGCSSFHLSSGYTSIGAKRYVFHWNRDKFPDPAAFVQSYLDAGVRLVANIKPALLLDHPRFAEVAAKGLFIADDEGAPTEIQYWDETGGALDFTNPDTAAWWRDQVTDALLRYGIAATWNDNNECEVWDARAQIASFGKARPASDSRPLQPLLMMRASRAAQIAHAPDKAPYVVTRSGMAGLHRYAQTWTGDNCTSWKTLRYNLKMGLGLALSGVSNMGHDVGGFAGPKPDPELFLRWVQAGVLMPRFSIHSWNDDGAVNEPWMHPEVLPAIRRLMALRQTLVPFFDDLACRYAHDFEPIVRPLWLDHPSDPPAWAEGDDHLLGRNLLVALVVEPGATSRTVRFPGTDPWYDVWTGETFQGGSTAVLPAPLDGLPLLFARAGSAMIVDAASQGFRPEPLKPALWLFPPVGEGAFQSECVDPVARSGGGPAPVGQWLFEGSASADTITLHVRGPGSADRLAFVLPPTETRRLEVTFLQ